MATGGEGIPKMATYPEDEATAATKKENIYLDLLDLPDLLSGEQVLAF